MPARSEKGLSMTSDLLKSEPVIRLACSLGVFTLMTLLETLHPKRERSFPRSQRWPNNLGVTLLDSLLARIVLPTSAVGFAVVVESHGLGFFNRVGLPAWLEIVVAVILLDLAIYGQHVLFHFAPVLWRFHRMHHADLDLDVTTGTRFHPIEILLSFGIKFVVVAAVGASPLSVLIFEVLLNATSLFNHSNLRLPRGLERLLRGFVVTPDMHRVHHSILSRETNSNFGFNLPWWDRLFRTYRPQPEAGHEGMTIGIDGFRDPKELHLDRMLTQPFRGDGSSRKK
jgi:sterol desaturase/sphingolipid hydroxylase (fatty acid hydroxylase superfamily)